MKGTRLRNVIGICLVMGLTFSACITPETRAKLDNAAVELQAAKDDTNSAKAELDRLIKLLNASTGEEAAKLEAIRVEAAKVLETAKLKEVEAQKLLIAAQAEASAERFRSGVQLAEWAHQGLGATIGTLLPAAGPALTIMGSIIASLASKGKVA